MRRFALVIVFGVACSDTFHLTLDEPMPTPSPSPTPSQATGLITSAGNAYARLDWTPNPAADAVTSYSVYEATASWSTWSTSLPGAFVTTGLTCCSTVRSGLTNETTYWFGVAARNAGGEGLVSAVVPGSPPAWIGTIQFGTSADDRPMEAVADSAGNIYVVGLTYGSLFGNTNQGDADAFIAKYDPSGTRLWTRLLATTSYERADAVAVDATHVYVAGSTLGALEGTNAGNTDVFVAKLSQVDGSTTWLQQHGGVGTENAAGVGVDSSGNVFAALSVAGAFAGTAIGGYDIVLLKLSSTDITYSRKLGSSVDDTATGLALDGNGDVYISGYTAGAFDGNTSLGVTDYVFIKYSNAGTKQFAMQRGTSADDLAWDVAATDTGDLYVSGHTYGSLDAKPNQGLTDQFIVRFDAAGVRQWTSVLGTTAADGAQGVEVARDGGVIVAGYSRGDFSGTGLFGIQDLTVSKLDAVTGNVTWKRQIGSTATNSGLSAVVGAGGVSYGMGETNGSVDARPHAGLYDAFVVKYSADGTRQN